MVSVVNRRSGAGSGSGSGAGSGTSSGAGSGQASGDGTDTSGDGNNSGSTSGEGTTEETKPPIDQEESGDDSPTRPSPHNRKPSKSNSHNVDQESSASGSADGNGSSSHSGTGSGSGNGSGDGETVEGLRSGNYIKVILTIEIHKYKQTRQIDTGRFICSRHPQDTNRLSKSTLQLAYLCFKTSSKIIRKSCRKHDVSKLHATVVSKSCTV